MKNLPYQKWTNEVSWHDVTIRIFFFRHVRVEYFREQKQFSRSFFRERIKCRSLFVCLELVVLIMVKWS